LPFHFDNIYIRQLQFGLPKSCLGSTPLISCSVLWESQRHGGRWTVNGDKGQRADLWWLWRRCCWRLLTGGWPGRCRSWKAEACGSRTAALARLWLFFLFLLSCSLLLLPLAVRLFYCSSSFFSFFFLVPGKEKLMVMLSFVCWLLASLTFSSSLFLLPIPCSAAAGSCGWCCRKVKLMVMCFLLIFLC